MMGYGFGGGWMWLFALLTLVSLVLLVAVLVRVVAGGLTPGPPRQDADQPSGRPGRAREILDERYARGELTTEEYQERLRILDQK